MLVHVVDQRCCGRSSSAARKADFSRSDVTNRARSSVVGLDALLVSMRACCTQFRSESDTIPACSPTGRQAALTLNPSDRDQVERQADRPLTQLVGFPPCRHDLHSAGVGSLHSSRGRISGTMTGVRADQGWSKNRMSPTSSRLMDVRLRTSARRWQSPARLVDASPGR